MDKSSIGELIRSQRKKVGLTITELAAKSGVSHPYISQIENNKFKPSPEILKKLSDPLGIPYPTLMHKAGYLDDGNLIINGEPTSQENTIIELIKLSTDGIMYEGESFSQKQAIILWNAILKERILELTDFLNRSSATYNGYELTDQDRQRILDMLNTLFPEYKERD